MMAERTSFCTVLEKIIIMYNLKILNGKKSSAKNKNADDETDKAITTLSHITGIERVHIEDFIFRCKNKTEKKYPELKHSYMKSYCKNRNIDYETIRDFSDVTDIRLYDVFGFITENIIDDYVKNEIAEAIQVSRTVLEGYFNGNIPMENTVLALVAMLQPDSETAIELYNLSGNSYSKLEKKAQKFKDEKNSSTSVLAVLKSFVLLNPSMYKTLDEWNSYFTDILSKDGNIKDKEFHLL